MPPSTQAVAYRANPAHTGAQNDALSSPIQVAWRAQLAGRPSYPLIADGRIYVIVQNVDARGGIAGGSTVVAMNASTGAVAWRHATVNNPDSAAYDAGRVFVQSGNGYITALNATTGAEIWTSSMSRGSNLYFTGAPLVAAGGVVLGMANSTLETYDETSGASLHDTDLLNGNSSSSPAVDGGRAFVTGGCADYAVTIATGAVAWAHERGCSGGSAGVATVAGGHVFAYDTASILNESTGAVVGSLPLTAQPVAVDGDTVLEVTADPPGYWQNSEVLRATTVAGDAKWTFYGDSYLDPSPIVDNGIVYVASRSGLVYQVDESTGHELFHAYAGERIDSDTEAGPFPRWGMAIGQGLLAVPTARGLTVFQQAPNGSPPVDLPAQLPPAGGYRITELGVNQGYLGTDAFGSAGGYVVGDRATQTTGGEVGHPVMWGPAGMSDWSSRLPPGRGSGAFSAVNKSGIAVGRYLDGSYDNRGFITTSAGAAAPLPNAFEPHAINSQSVAAGEAYGTGCFAAATWTNMVEHVLTSAGRCGGAFDINNAGDVAGFEVIGGRNQAMVWSNGATHVIEGGCSAIALGISPDSTVVGWADFTQCGMHHAFVWRDGVMTDLGTGGGVQAEATAIGPNDQPVGIAIGLGDEQWDVTWRNGYPVVIQTLIDPNFGWVLGTPVHVDELGRITGTGLRYGARRGFVLTPVPNRGAAQGSPATQPPRSPAPPATPAPSATPRARPTT